MKLGIVGTGLIVNELMSFYDSLKIEKTFILCTERSIEKAKIMCQNHHLDGYTTNYQEFLNYDIDTVYVAVNNNFHFQFAKEAIENNKNVILEKPMTTHEKYTKQLFELAHKHNVILIEAMTIYFLPAYLAIKEEIKNIGKVKVVSCNYTQYSSRYDKFKEGIILPAFDVKMAGGALMDINVYNVSFIVGLFGKPKEVNYVANIDKGIDTSGILTLKYDGFVASAIGAKDCMSAYTNSIEAENGGISFINAPHDIRNYQLHRKDGYRTYVESEFNDKSNTHRMYPEWIKFIEMIKNKDFEEMKEYEEYSIIVSEILTEARLKQQISFEED